LINKLNRISELEQELSHYKIDYIFYKYGIDTNSLDFQFKGRNIPEKGASGKIEELDIKGLKNVLFKNE
jgi:hypothetical protein